MKMQDKIEHWQKVYNTKNPDEVSWTQSKPQPSLDLVLNACTTKHDAIIDVGGGDSHLADALLDLGYTNITVLDISAKALSRAKQRLGDKANRVKWVCSDILTYQPNQKIDVWHDRAAFHFLTDPKDVEKYAQLLTKAKVNSLVLGTFAKNGPVKCSGLDITQYSEESMKKVFSPAFSPKQFVEHQHQTPFQTHQNFLFGCFSNTLNNS